MAINQTIFMEPLPFVTHLSVTRLVLLVLATIFIVVGTLRFVWNRAERKGYPLPPGPAPLPLLGNALSIDPQQPWVTYTSWRPQFGDIVYARILDIDIVVLNSFSVAKDLLESRSQIYSDRPFIATLKPYGLDRVLSSLPYNAEWKSGRRIMHQTFHAEASYAFRPMQLHWARQTVMNIINDPDDYPSYFSTFSSAVSLSAVYDYNPQLPKDPVVALGDDFLRLSFAAVFSEKLLLVKLFPFLLNIPKWIPRLSWIKREAEESCSLGTQTKETLYQSVRRRVHAKEAIDPSTMVINHMHRMEQMGDSVRAEYEDSLKFTAVSSFLGSMETTTATLLFFTLAMIKNPRVWKRAQADIDAVIGTDRLPEFEDRPSLPYIDAIVRETLRWRPVLPMGVPHATTTSDIYNGYYIPRGATVIANLWAISRDETHYPDPEEFIPERYLDSAGMLNGNDPAEFAFGFGRRACPGRHTGDAAVWIAVATLLSTLDFNVPKDLSGKDIEFEPQFTGGVTQRPLSFPCKMTLRAHISKQAFQRFLAQ